MLVTHIRQVSRISPEKMAFKVKFYAHARPLNLHRPLHRPLHTTPPSLSSDLAPSTISESLYIEKWQSTCVKDNNFYEKHAKERTYFYSIDLQGRLFLEEVRLERVGERVGLGERVG